MTSVTAWMLCSIMAEAGLPAGVVNMVFGYGATAGEAIVTHPKVIVDLRDFYTIYSNPKRPPKKEPS